MVSTIRSLILGFLITTFCVAVSADAQTIPEAAPGWTHPSSGNSFSPVPDEGHGLLLPGNGVSYSAPVVAELDGDPSNGNEAAVVSNNGTVNVFRSNGSLLWTARLPNARCKQGRSSTRSYSTPAVGNLFGDGTQYLVVGYGGFSLNTKRCGGGVGRIVEPITAAQLFRFGHRPLP